MTQKILTYDSTLRDGEQSEGITLSLEDKLRIVERLDAFGIDAIEGGFPASNPKDIAFFQRVRELPLAHARIAAFGSTCKKGVAAADDQGLADLVASGAPIVTIVGKTWDAQVTRALLTTLDENLYIADEVFMTGSAAELTPIGSVDGREIGKPGEVTRALQDRYFAVTYGQIDDYADWLAEV